MKARSESLVLSFAVLLILKCLSGARYPVGLCGDLDIAIQPELLWDQAGQPHPDHGQRD